MATEQELDQAIEDQRHAIAWTREIAERAQSLSERSVAAHERIASALERIAYTPEGRA